MTRTHARVCRFWLSLILHPISGIKLPKNPNFGGVNRHFPAKRVKYWNVHIIKTTASIITKFCRVIDTHKYSLWVVQICPKRLQYGGRPPSWKIEKSQYLRNRLTDFDKNLALRCLSTLWTLITNKILRFQKSKITAAAILKIRKIAISRNRTTDFDEIWHSYVSGPSRHRQPITFNKFENVIWRRPPSWKIEKS